MSEDEGSGLIRSDAEVALDELVLALARAAEIHRHGAERLGEGAAAAALRELAETREAAVEALLAAGQRSDAPPAEPDPDRLTVEGLVQEVRGLLSPDAAPVLLRASRTAEQSLDEALGAVRAHSYPREIEAALAPLSAAPEQARRALDAARAAAEGPED